MNDVDRALNYEKNKDFDNALVFALKSIPAKYDAKKTPVAMFDEHYNLGVRLKSPLIYLKVMLVQDIPLDVKMLMNQGLIIRIAEASALPNKIPEKQLEAWREVISNKKIFTTEVQQMVTGLAQDLGIRLNDPKTEGIIVNDLYGAIPTKFTAEFEKEFHEKSMFAIVATNNPKLVLKIANMRGIPETFKMYIEYTIAMMIAPAAMNTDKMPDEIVAQWKEVFANKKKFEITTQRMLDPLESLLGDRLKALAMQDSKESFVKNLHKNSKKDQTTKKKNIVVR